jgi:hypothetical protein
MTRLFDVPIGLLFNFHEPVLKNGIFRMILPGANQPGGSGFREGFAVGSRRLPSFVFFVAFCKKSLLYRRPTKEMKVRAVIEERPSLSPFPSVEPAFLRDAGVSRASFSSLPSVKNPSAIFVSFCSNARVKKLLRKMS